MVRRAFPTLVSAVALSVAAAHAQPAPERGGEWIDKPPVDARRFMVVAAHPLAVDVGHSILARGGSAVDAAVAVQLVLGLVEPQSSGLGGGGFMLVHDARTKKLHAYDGREVAPASAQSGRFLDRDGRPLPFVDAAVGGLGVGVPGIPALLETVHRRHGRMRWQQLFAPAIAMAEQGFAVSPRLAMQLRRERLARPGLVRRFSREDGRLLNAGDVLRNVDYARTLRALAGRGAAAFYRGPIAEDIVDTVRSDPFAPGDLTLQDLAAYRVREREPVCAAYRAHRVCSMPLPSSGGPTLLQMLALLEPYDIASMRDSPFWSTHFIAEAGRLAYADRAAYMADPDFVAPPRGLLSRPYLRERSRLIGTTSSLRRATAGAPDSAPSRTALHHHDELPSTSHVSIVDRHGNAVSFTTSIENAFGSQLVTRGGFLLNNQLTDFSFVPHVDGMPVANRVEPGKRPRSSMAPTIVYDERGRVSIVTGSPGGSAIINYVVKNVVAIVDWKLDPQAAAALPNVGSRNGPTELERGTEAALLEDRLRALGHDVRLIDQTSGVHTIVRSPRGWQGGADPRREGVARGD